MNILINPCTNYKTFNQLIKKEKTYPRTSSNVNFPSIEYIANYNISFGSRAIYAINQDGSTQKYKSIIQAARELGLSRSAIDSVLNGTSYISNKKYVFEYADKLEKTDKNGQRSIDIEKLKDKLQQFSHTNNNAIYSLMTMVTSF